MTGAARNRRIAQLGAVALLAVVVLIAAIALSRSGSDEPAQGAGNPDNGGEVAGAGDAAALLRGIAQHGSVLGDPKAGLTLIEYADLQCPFCRQYALEVLPAIIERYVRPGRLKLDLRLIPILGPDSDRAARAAIVAGERDRYWQFADLFYRNQGLEGSGYVTDEFLSRIGSGAGVDGRTVVARSSAPAVTARLKRFESQAGAAGLDSTPTFELARRGRAPARFEPEALEAAAFTTGIDRALRAVER